MNDSLVTTERRDGVLICHIDDGKANALAQAMITAITDALGEAESDDSVHAVVLHGREGKFSAGFDLNVNAATTSQQWSTWSPTGASLFGGSTPHQCL